LRASTSCQFKAGGCLSIDEWIAREPSIDRTLADHDSGAESWLTGHLLQKRWYLPSLALMIFPSQ
jgi:hypothetical protein